MTSSRRPLLRTVPESYRTAHPGVLIRPGTGYELPVQVGWYS